MTDDFKTPDGSKKVVFVLMGIIVILVGVLSYVFLIKPAIQNYATQKQNEGILVCINDIFTQLNQKGFVQIVVSENQSLILAPYVPKQ